jgi:hypothetical protein
MNNDENDSIFGEVIYAYTRAQAIADGGQVEVSKVATEAGIRFPVFLKRMQFSFSWPPSLVIDGKCTGSARLTLVSTPPLDYKFGVEFVRINMNASLRQEQKNGKFKSQLEPIYLPDNQRTGSAEADLIEFGLKWGPVKAYAGTFPKGVGPSTNWHLDVEYILRDGEVMPKNGVPFTVLLTIGDPKNEKPVFNDVRQMLQSVGVETSDIRTAARIVTRV